MLTGVRAVQHIAKNDTYWDQVCQVVLRFPRPAADLAIYFRKYTVLFDSASDVFSLISPQDSELTGLFTAHLLCLLKLISPKFGEHWSKRLRISSLSSAS
jgi:hypothetical protein